MGYNSYTASPTKGKGYWTINNIRRSFCGKYIQRNIQIQQNASFVAGKCLRVFALGVTGNISKGGCKLVQIVDRAFGPFFKAYMYKSCFESSKSSFCKNTKYIQGLEKAKKEFASDTFPAQHIAAAIIKKDRSEIFDP